MTLTDAAIAELRALLVDQAFPLPWKTKGLDLVVDADGDALSFQASPTSLSVRLLVATVNALPLLLDERDEDHLEIKAWRTRYREHEEGLEKELREEFGDIEAEREAFLATSYGEPFRDRPRKWTEIVMKALADRDDALDRLRKAAEPDPCTDFGLPVNDESGPLEAPEVQL